LATKMPWTGWTALGNSVVNVNVLSIAGSVIWRYAVNGVIRG
jgi:hypothetical protein